MTVIVRTRKETPTPSHLRTVAACVLMSVALQASALPLAAQQTTPAMQTAPATTTAPAQTAAPAPSATSPDVPSPDAPSPTTPSPATAQTTPATPSSSTSPQQNPQHNPDGQAPVGTAAAPAEKSVGIAASRPAGAVIAPAKQKRTRAFAIRVGLLVGAAVAVGTVAGLSAASPSRPH